jgi:hypothetical protein
MLVIDAERGIEDRRFGDGRFEPLIFTRIHEAAVIKKIMKKASLKGESVIVWALRL